MSILAVLQQAGFSEDEARQYMLEAMKRGGMEGEPKLKFAGPDHWLFQVPGRNVPLARAARDNKGQEWLYVNNEPGAIKPGELEGWIGHEVGHFKAWREAGEQIRPHGNAFRKACRQTVPGRHNYFCKGLYD